jgi:protein TonB
VKYDNVVPKPKKGTTVNQKQQFLALAAAALRRHTPGSTTLGPGDAEVTFRVTAGGDIADISATGTSASHVALVCKLVSSIRLPPPPGGAFVASQAFAFH